MYYILNHNIITVAIFIYCTYVIIKYCGSLKKWLPKRVTLLEGVTVVVSVALLRKYVTMEVSIEVSHTQNTT